MKKKYFDILVEQLCYVKKNDLEKNREMGDIDYLNLPITDTSEKSVFYRYKNDYKNVSKFELITLRAMWMYISKYNIKKDSYLYNSVDDVSKLLIKYWNNLKRGESLVETLGEIQPSGVLTILSHTRDYIKKGNTRKKKNSSNLDKDDLKEVSLVPDPSMYNGETLYNEIINFEIELGGDSEK